jgi:hypothetical protein
MVIIVLLKLNSGDDPRQRLGHWSSLMSWVGLTRVNVKIKMVIVIVLKSSLGVDLGQDLVYE